MTNDTTTLNGALQELGETMADNLVTMGVTDADASDGLTTLANKILDVPQGSCLTLDLTSDKSILSYADTESATLTATVTNNGTPKSGESVQFYIDDVAWGSPVTTNASGVATKTYNSSGVGDITVKAECRLLTKTYSIEDCWKYFTEQSASIQNFQLPSAFKINCTLVKNTAGYNGVIHLWQTANTTVGFGIIGQDVYNYELGYYNGSTWSRQVLGTSSRGQSVNLTFTYENGVFTLSDGVNSVTYSKTCSNPLTKFQIEHSNGVSFSNVKIKPL